MSQEAFLWQRHQEAEHYLNVELGKLCGANGALDRLQKRLASETSTRLFDWLDHVGLVHSDIEEAKLSEVGFEVEQKCDGYWIYSHPGAQLPRVVLHDPEKFRLHGVAVKVESIADFLCAHGLSSQIEGSPFGGYRRCAVAMENGVELWIEERRGTRTIEPTHENGDYLERYFEARELWQTRSRHWEDQVDCLNHSIDRARQMVDLVGPHVAAQLVCEVERAYWQSRNKAAQLQKGRQDRLGMGWANHDHHTFRSSRKLFPELVSLFELLGFTCRERFYAGEEAGWGAQVMENAQAGLILFLDVDLAPEEVAVDFAHQTLEELPELGTVGLWCGLHGDSILSSGMHHLEGQFNFDALRDDLDQEGVGMMQPFSDFPYLRQAFTVGEQWPVKTHRLRALHDKGLITDEEADVFLREGAVGSHLENLERHEGFKGFNQKNVSYIIRKTDPRTLKSEITLA